MEPREVIQHAGLLIEGLYFIESGMASLVMILEEGNAVEVATVGNSGVVGSELVSGEHISFVQGLSQIRGEALRLPRPRLLQALPSCPVLKMRLMRYRELLYAVAAQSAGCGQHHDVNHRLARWLLTVADAVRSPEFLLTQELLSEMLAVQRPTVTIAAHTLQTAGLLTYRRGRIAITDREALEDVSCGCYHTLRIQYDRLDD